MFDGFNDSSDYEVPLLNVYTDSSYAHLHEWKQYQNNDLFLNNDHENYVNIHYSGVGHMGVCDLSLASPFLSLLLDGVYPKVSAKEQLIILNADCLEFVQTQCNVEINIFFESIGRTQNTCISNGL